MVSQVAIDEKLFCDLQPLDLFLLIDNNEKDGLRLNKTIYQKCPYGGANAVQLNCKDNAPSKGWISVDDQQLVIILS